MSLLSIALQQVQRPSLPPPDLKMPAVRPASRSAKSPFAIAIEQVQLKPQYIPCYSAEPKSESGRPLSKLRMARKEILYAISRELGESIHADLLAAMRETDPKINKDYARKLLDELCDEKRMDKRTVYSPGKKVLYTARPE